MNAGFGLLLLRAGLGKVPKPIGGACGCFIIGLGRVVGVRLADMVVLSAPVKRLLTGVAVLKMLLALGGLAARPRPIVEKKEFYEPVGLWVLMSSCRLGAFAGGFKKGLALSGVCDSSALVYLTGVPAKFYCIFS